MPDEVILLSHLVLVCAVMMFAEVREKEKMYINFRLVSSVKFRHGEML